MYLRLPEEICHLHPQLGQFLTLLDSFSPERCYSFTGDNTDDVVRPDHIVDLLGQLLANGVDAVVILRRCLL